MAPSYKDNHPGVLFVKFMVAFSDVLDKAFTFFGLAKKTEVLKYLTRYPAKFIKPNPLIEIDHIEVAEVPVSVTTSRRHDHSSLDNIGIIYIHGGGWALGHPDVLNDIQIDMASQLDAIVFSPDYVMTPEKKYPGSLDDCYAVCSSILTNAVKYRVSPHKIVIMGESAGGNLTAAVCLKLRDKKFPVQPSLQVLLSPCLQAIDFCTDSYLLTNPTILKRRGMIEMWNAYGVGSYEDVELCMQNRHIPPSELAKYRLLMGATSPQEQQKEKKEEVEKKEEKEDEEEKEGEKEDTRTLEAWERLKTAFTCPYVSPLCAKSLSHLPAALVVINGDDVLADEGVWYVKRLQLEGTAHAGGTGAGGKGGVAGASGGKENQAETGDRGTVGGGDKTTGKTEMVGEGDLESDGKVGDAKLSAHGKVDDVERDPKDSEEGSDGSAGEGVEFKRRRGHVTHVHYEHSYHAAMSLIPFTREAVQQRRHLAEFISDFYT